MNFPTDDTYWIVIGNSNTEHFFHVITDILLETVDKIIEIAGKQDELYKKSVVSVDGKVLF